MRQEEFGQSLADPAEEVLLARRPAFVQLAAVPRGTLSPVGTDAGARAPLLEQPDDQPVA